MGGQLGWSTDQASGECSEVVVAIGMACDGVRLRLFRVVRDYARTTYPTCIIIKVYLA